MVETVEIGLTGVLISFHGKFWRLIRYFDIKVISNLEVIVPAFSSPLREYKTTSW